MTTYADLRNQGLKHLEQMAGGRWTDFNIHDPGITLLETFCYALTDLAYRITHDVPDLLADGGSNPYASLHQPADILTTRAVTANDLRRLVLDTVGVKNAWIEPIEERLANDVPVRGLYRVAIDASQEQEGVHVRRDVGKMLHKHRGLCEDFVDIVILEPLDICIDAKIEIGRVDDPAVTYGEILDAISEIVSPTVHTTTLAERFDAGLRIEEIFDGPLLQHGFITDEALARARRRLALHSSDIVHAVMDVPGVRAVTEVVLRTGDAKDTWSLELPKDRAPRLDRIRSSIQLLNAGLSVAVGAVPPDAPRIPRTTLGPNGGITPLPSRPRNVGVYHSVQHHLPLIYGIGDVGLPAEVPPERKARAKQLKAYLMFFDQLMANQFAQLAHVKDLFSMRDSVQGISERTYFTQIVDEPTLGLDAIAKATQETLDSMVEGPADQLTRKHRFLNHLLARFAENLNDRYSAAIGDASDASEKIIQYKQAFLQNYPRISGSRGTAFDGLGRLHRDNTSGLEDRIHYKLGLFDENGETMAVVEHVHLRESRLHRFDWFRTHYFPQTRDPYSLAMTFVFPGHKGRFANVESGDVYPFRQIVEQTVRAQTPAHISTYVVWLNATEWDEFYGVYVEWRRVRREHLASKLGISLGLDARLQAMIHGLRPVPGVIQPTHDVDYDAQITVDVFGSQEGNALYSLVREIDGELFSATSTIGTGKTISVTSNAVTEDLVIRVQVERLFDDTILLDATLPVKVRANPRLVARATVSPLVAPAVLSTITIEATQVSAKYSVYVLPLADGDFFVPAGSPALEVTIPAITNLPVMPTARVSLPAVQTWTAPDAQAIPGNGGNLQLSVGTITRDSIVIVRAHKDHAIVDKGDNNALKVYSTDVQLEKAVVLLVRPKPVSLVLTEVASGKVAVTGGETGVLYYLIDPTTHMPLGKPAYFHRQDEVVTTRNWGIGKLRVRRDFVVARGSVAPGANRATTLALDPIVTVSSLPANRIVEVMAVRARTGVAWAEAQTFSVGAAASP